MFILMLDVPFLILSLHQRQMTTMRKDKTQKRQSSILCLSWYDELSSLWLYLFYVLHLNSKWSHDTVCNLHTDIWIKWDVLSSCGSVWYCVVINFRSTCLRVWLEATFTSSQAQSTDFMLYRAVQSLSFYSLKICPPNTHFNMEIFLLQDSERACRNNTRPPSELQVRRCYLVKTFL